MEIWAHFAIFPHVDPRCSLTDMSTMIFLFFTAALSGQASTSTGTGAGRCRATSGTLAPSELLPLQVCS